MSILSASSNVVNIDQFKENIQSVCGRFLVNPVLRRPEVRSDVKLSSNGGFDIVSVTQDTHSIERSAMDVRRDPGEHFFLILQERGCAQLGQGDHLQAVPEGDMFVVDSTMPSRFQYHGQLTTQLSLHLPREEMIHRFGKRVYGGMQISGRDPLAQAMRSILNSLVNTNDPSQTHVSEAFYSVLGAYLLNRAIGEASRPDPRRLLVQRATDVMAQNFREPGFSVSHVADILNVSRRHLQRAFRFVGNTPRERLMDMRLDTARRMLNDHQAKSVAQVAYDCGFSDLSTFHRQYKARFKAPPGTEIKTRRLLQ